MGERTQVLVGVRYSRFKANFNFVEGNEEFDYGDADDSVNQPTWRPTLLLGVPYRLGR